MIHSCVWDDIWLLIVAWSCDNSARGCGYVHGGCGYVYEEGVAMYMKRVWLCI